MSNEEMLIASIFILLVGGLCGIYALLCWLEKAFLKLKNKRKKDINEH